MYRHAHIEFKKCPACGHDKTIAQEIKAEEVAKGRMGEDTQLAVQHLQVAMVDPRRMDKLLTIPILLAALDICANCGNLYCISAQVVNGDIRGVKSPPLPQGPGTFFGKPMVGM